MYNTLLKYKYLLILSCLLLSALFTINNSLTQVKDENEGRTKTVEFIKSKLDSLQGRWAGYLSSDSAGKIIIGMNISVKGDSIFGNSTIQWPSKVSTQIFKGRYDKNSNTFTLFESQDDKKAGVYQCSFKNENNRFIITGTWTRNRDNREFKCELDKTGGLTFATQNPVDIMKKLIENINNYAKTRDDDYIKPVYYAWLSPEVRIGNIDNFKQGFSTTLSDEILTLAELSNPKINISFTSNPQKLKEVEGIFSIISVIHQAVEYVRDGDSVKLQHSIYRGDYQFIVSNGVWKIISGKAKLLDRHNPDTLYTAADLQKKYNISQLSSLLEITNVSPNPANENDTITISYVQNSADELQDIKVFFDNIEAKITDDKVFGQVKCIVPGGMTNNNPDIRLKSSGIEGQRYKSFEIKSSLPWYLKIPWYVVVMLILLMIGIVFYAKYRTDALSQEKLKLALETERLTKEKEQITTNISQFLETKEPETISLPDPEVPIELIEACKKDNCVLFASSEISAMGGYPSSQDFVLNLINWSIENNYLSDYQRDLLIASVKSGRYDNAIENTVAALQGKNVNIKEYIKNIYSKPASMQPEVLKYISDTSFSFYVSSNYDSLIERSFKEPLQVFTNKDTDKLRVSFTNKTPFIFKIYGKIEDPESLILTPSQFSDAVFQNIQLSKFIENVFYSRMVFCIGADIDAIERFMNNINIRSSSQQKHYALVSVKGADWQTRAYTLERRYGLKVIPYTSGNNSQFENFMKTLYEKAPATLYSNKIKESQHSPIRKLQLENIGPFENIELELDSNWNILLGDNGVGKSTILKAIAAGLCGEYSAPYANRLINIKSRTKSGTITITTDNAKYVTTIHDDETRAKITTNAPSIIYGGSLKIGFPPLRTVTWETSTDTYAGQDHPINEDILPILTGEIDPRMDKLKRWLIDLKGNSTGLDEDDTRPKNKYAELIVKFFEIVRKLTPGLEIKYSKIDTVAKKVYIQTYDTVIPIESISQGTLSLTSWVGILLQRLYEIHGEAVSDPTQMYALVLMDEIDAHMHPAWQRKIVYNLKKLFPNIQFVVTTHSPLVVGGLPPEQIIKFTRNEMGIVDAIRINKGETFGRSNQILTSSMFGLDVTLDVDTENVLTEYKELFKKENRNPDEEKRFENLKQELKERSPGLAENPFENKAQVRLQEWLKMKSSNISEQEMDEMIKYSQSKKEKK